MVVFVMGGEQSDNKGISDAVKREITQGLLEGFWEDKGIAVAGTCVFYDFESCEGVYLSSRNVSCIAC